MVGVSRDNFTHFEMASNKECVSNRLERRCMKRNPAANIRSNCFQKKVKAAKTQASCEVACQKEATRDSPCVFYIFFQDVRVGKFIFTINKCRQGQDITCWLLKAYSKKKIFQLLPADFAIH